MEKRVHDIVLVAMENNWEAVQAHMERIGSIIEVILRDGIESGEFERVEPRETSLLIKRSMVAFCHPLMLAEGLRDGCDLEKEGRHRKRQPRLDSGRLGLRLRDTHMNLTSRSFGNPTARIQ